MLITNIYSDKIEAGCDEAGRGCLAGSVFAASVILPKDFFCKDLNDSKKLTAQKRDRLRQIIIDESIAWGVGEVSAAEIDSINILNASFLAMTRAVEALNSFPDILLIDGNRFRSSLNIPFECIVKGDAKIASIAAASILAKTFRDEYIEKMAKDYPMYGWDRNKGYPTKEHRQAILTYGTTPIHRRTFCGCDTKQLSLF